MYICLTSTYLSITCKGQNQKMSSNRLAMQKMFHKARQKKFEPALINTIIAHIKQWDLTSSASWTPSISDLLDAAWPPLTAPMREEVVVKWSGAVVCRLRVLTVFTELPGSTGSRSSGLIKAWETGSCADPDEGFLSVLAEVTPVWLSEGDEIKIKFSN